jgi:hypothetical protein
MRYPSRKKRNRKIYVDCNDTLVYVEDVLVKIEMGKTLSNMA